MVLLFVITGVVRIGPALVESPVVPAPYPGGRRTAFPHPMVRRGDGVKNRI